MGAERDTAGLRRCWAGWALDLRLVLTRAVDARRGRLSAVIVIAAGALIVVAVGGSEPGTLYVLAAVLGALGGLVVLPDGLVSVATIRARARAAAIVVAAGVAWAALAVAIASVLRLAIGDDGGVGVGVALVTLGSYVLGAVAALALTSAAGAHGER